MASGSLGIGPVASSAANMPLHRALYSRRPLAPGIFSGLWSMTPLFQPLLREIGDGA